ncbi:hypothetical protein [uncultured Aquimonas sp.]|jgi:hypothetical protein|nr:hypothetical protein [uncultured Aquimonas sp.]
MSPQALKRWLLLAAAALLAMAGLLWARFGSEVFLQGLGPLFCA